MIHKRCNPGSLRRPVLRRLVFQPGRSDTLCSGKNGKHKPSVSGYIVCLRLSFHWQKPEDHYANDGVEMGHVRKHCIEFEVFGQS